MLVIIGFGVLLAVNMFLLAVESGATPAGAAMIAVALCVTMPVAPYAFLLFPEIPAATLLMYAIRRVALGEQSDRRWILTGMSIGLLPWLHQRFVPTAIVLGVIALIHLASRERLTAFASFATPLIVFGTGLIGYNLWLYGGPIQDSADHAGFHGALGAVNAAFGLLLDAQWGLLIAAPLYLLAVVYSPAWFRCNRVGAVAAAAVAPYLLVVAAYEVWWGEWGPPARYLVPVAPVAAGAIAHGLRRRGQISRLLAEFLWLSGAALTIVGFASPQRFYHHPNGHNNLIATIGSWLRIDLASHLVSFQPFAESPVHERIAASFVLLATGIGLALVLFLPPRIRSIDDHRAER
jgi:hypothetical protein